MKYFSMFSGVGGFELGIQRAMEQISLLQERQEEERDTGNEYNEIERSKRYSGQSSTTSNIKEASGERDTESRSDVPNINRESSTHWRSEPSTCVGVCEWYKYSSIVLEKRFPGVKNYGDATTIKTDELPDFDMLVGGFPCQTFSIAGNRAGFDDTRGTMFFEIVRVLKAKRPEYCVLENVKGLLSHDKGKTFLTILSTLQELGYNVEWGVLNSRYFGVPQNRERVFIIGRLRERGRSKVFPLRIGNGQGNKTSEFKVSNASPREFGFKDYCPCMVARDYKEPKIVKNDVSIRRLTPVECERLQGFPDAWTLVKMPNDKMMSNSQRYKMMGNAVTVNVVQAIMEKLFEFRRSFKEKIENEKK